MKNFTLGLVFLASSLLGYSQAQISKRIKINNPTNAELLKVKKAGIDLSCGAIFTNHSLILELGANELDMLKKQHVNYSVLVDDLTAHYKKKNEIELPLAKAQLQAKKSQTLASRSLSTKSTSINNFIQYEGCSEVDWGVPVNFNLGSMGGCLTYSEVLAELDQMRALYPNLISVKANASPSNQLTNGNSYTNGGAYNSWSGSTIYYVRISDNPDVDEPNEPESLYSGMTHSREVSSLMNLMYYMWYILENYNTDAGIKNLVDNHEMYFIPIANPDGLRWNEQVAPNGGGQQRKNLGPYNTGNNVLRGVDLNRNYDYFWGPNSIYGGSSGSQSSNTYRGPSAFSEPETQIVRDFSATRNFKTAMNHHATSNLIPHAYNGYPNAPASGREAEYHKFCHDMTRFNRYIYGEAPDILTIANGDMSDWMLGGVTDINGSNGSGQGILALAPENGSWISSDGEGGFWPNATKIVEIAERAVRMNFVNAYHSGKFAQFHDLNNTSITTTSGNLEFGLEYLGQTLGDITLNVTPVSSNITSITPPPTQTGWSKLEQRTVTAAYTLDAGIQANDEIEFQITLSNDDGYVMYRANIIKHYNPTVLFADNPDTDNLTNWTASGGAWGTTSDSYSGTTAITDSPSGAYGNNQSKILTLNTTINLASATASVVQFYAKWDIERNFDYVQIQGSTNGSTWLPLCGKYSKPGSSRSTNRYSSGNSSNTSTGKSTSDQNNQPTGEPIYDADTMDKWVMEEILIDGTENSFLFEASNAQFRFVFDSDNSNRADGYPTTFDGFIFDDFKVTTIQTPCLVSVPVNLVSNNITATEATISWDNIPSATYDLRYRIVGETNWTDISGISSPITTLTGLNSVTNYEVQVRSNCGANNSVYSTLINFTTLDVVLNYCDSASTNVNDEFISNVQLNTINNSSGAQFYSDFTDISTTLTKEEQYTITITPTWTGTVYNEAYSVWIDYNRDGDFNDSGEQVWTQGNTKTASVSGNFIVPTNAVESSTRMRVSMKYNAIPSSCETFQYGEVEDYTIIIESSGPDVVAPVITLNGASAVDLNLGDIYTEEGATATDNIDGDITASIVIGGNVVDTNTAGTYVVTYNVSDAAGNAAPQVERTVNVIPDTTAPVITLVGSSPININVGGVYTEEGATATDNIDGDVTASIVIGGDVVDTNTAGTYVVTYNVSDTAGNAALQVERTVNVVPDTTAPVITLNGASAVDLNLGDIYTEEGATATDNIDGDITASIVIGGDIVDTNSANTYIVTYNVVDNSGNNAVEVTRTVNVLPDTTAPIISLLGASVINLNVGDVYTELGATATDNIDGDITASIVIAGDVVNTNIAGSYNVTYNVSDAAGNLATEVSRSVIVSEANTGCSGGIASFPYNEGFENTLGAWTQSTSDDINWIVDASGTPSNNTGPSSAIQGNYYVYVEASSPNYPSRRAILNSPCFDLSGLTEATFSFNYHMYGASDMGSIDLEITQDEGLTWTSIWNETGNKGNSWQNAIIDLSAYTGGGIQLRFNRFVGSTWQADIAIDNVSLVDGEIVVNGCTGGITSYPYTEGYENTLGLWTQSNADDINWTIDANGTPSNNTGPSSAAQGSYYIYVEASGNGTGYPNKRAIINSPCYDLSTVSQANFSFSYHMYGASDMGTITLEASHDNGISWAPIWSESGNKGNTWLSVNIDLSIFIGNSVQLRFNRVTGGTWQADVAIDNISLTIAALAKNELKEENVLNISTHSVNKLTLYPNPVEEVLNIKTLKGGNLSYKIINALGQVVNKGKTTKAIVVDNLEAGMYYIEVENNGIKIMKRFIKE
ncbi:immunoglobulin-like domain-containing protein [Algibacter sp. PT7-4]|uniref:immunoglobulin-like domain-containing protein n=1 Tax=Algibacter ulvanivorans TaxID=3400999 RepID=UPI003AB02F50